MRDFLRHHLDPRQEPFWKLLLALGVAFRFWNVIGYRSPFDTAYSDAYRHLDNARHFLDPGPQGASNPFLYQLFLWIVLKATHEQRLPVGIVAAWQSILYVFFWYLFAIQVVRRRITALRFSVVLSFIPTHISMFSFFMNETLLGPLLGAAFAATAVAMNRRKLGWYLLAVALLVLSVLTRSVVMPISIIALAWALSRQRRKVVAGALSVAIVALAMVYPSIRAYPILHRYTPFGDNLTQPIYFASGAESYQVNFLGRGTYGFASPSFYVSPFYPFYEWKTSRKGTFKFTVDANKQGEDLRETLRRVIKENRAKLPRLIAENWLIISFSHSWPDSGKEGTPAVICLWERWIWFPLFVFTFFGSVVYVRRRGLHMVPVLTALMTLGLYASQGAIMEGRYRKPLEPVVLLAFFWLLDAKMTRPWRTRLPLAATPPKPGLLSAAE
jgi:hypothetical protein